MANKNQTSIGGTVTVPASGTAKVAHRFDGGEWINIVEAYASANGAINANFYIDQVSGQRIPILTRADDGPDTPKAGNYPVELSNSARTRFLTLIQMDSGDKLVAEFENTTTADEKAYLSAGAAGTAEIALGNGGI